MRRSSSAQANNPSPMRTSIQDILANIEKLNAELREEYDRLAEKYGFALKEKEGIIDYLIQKIAKIQSKNQIVSRIQPLVTPSVPKINNKLLAQISEYDRKIQIALNHKVTKTDVYYFYGKLKRKGAFAQSVTFENIEEIITPIHKLKSSEAMNELQRSEKSSKNSFILDKIIKECISN